jgi:transcription antitermination factor NusG
MSFALDVNCWYVIRVRRGSEIVAAHGLKARGYEYYLPLRSSHQKMCRPAHDGTPLFSGYVFCRITEQVLAPILTTPGVMSIVGIRGIPTPIAEAEITAIRCIETNNGEMTPMPLVTGGHPVVITSGPLQGLSGLLVSIRDVDRLVISLHLLRRSVAVEIDTSCVTLCRGAAR